MTTNLTQTEITQRNHHRAVRYFWAWLSIATSVSLAGNAAYAWFTAAPDTRWLAACVAAVPPTVLLLAVHGLAVLANATASGAVYRAAIAATAALAMCAFVLSFVALRDLAVLAGIAPDLAPVLPLVIDLAIGVATLALVAIGDKPERRGRYATRIAGSIAAPGVSTATSKRDAATNSPRAGATVDRAEATTKDKRSTAPGADDSIRELAETLVAKKVTRQSVDKVAAILAAHDHGDPLNRIAKQLGAHHTAVSRVIEAAAAHNQRTLAAV